MRVAGRDYVFAEGERIHTENSHKYTIEEFQATRRRLGLDAGQGLDRP